MNILKIKPPRQQSSFDQSSNILELSQIDSSNPSFAKPSGPSLHAPREKKGFSFKKFVERRVNKSAHYIKSFDQYGQPITLHYQGEDTFKTCPGGFISLIVLFFITMYTILKGKSMFQRQDWTLIQQTVVSSVEELNNAYDLGSQTYSNISISLQFYEKKAKQTAALKNAAEQAKG